MKNTVADSPARAFVRVDYTCPSGTRRQLSPQNFAGLPLSERIRCVLERRARFIDGGGQAVTSRAALAWLRESGAADGLG